MLGWEVIPRIPLGNLSVSPHGVGIAIGYFIGATLMARRARKTGFDEDHAWNAAVVGILGAIIGARVAYVIGHSNQFNEPIEYLQIYKGGISLMGGLIGGFIAAWLYCRAKKLDFVRLADLGAAGLAIGTTIGRIGDLVIGDHLGRTTDGFWGWEYKGGELISAPPCDPAVYPSANGCIQPGMVVHQTALYDSLWALVIFFVIVRLERKPRPKGFLILTWAAMYSLGRILTDLTRVDKTWFGTGLTGSQLTAICVLVLSLFFLSRLRKAPKAAPVAPAADSGTTDSETAVEGDEDAAAVAATLPAAAPDSEAQPIEEPAGAVDPVEQAPAAEEAVEVSEPDEEPGQSDDAPAAEDTAAAVEPVEPDGAPAEGTVVIVETVAEPAPSEEVPEPAAQGPGVVETVAEPAASDDPPEAASGPAEVVVPVEPVDADAPESVDVEESAATGDEPAKRQEP